MIPLPKLSDALAEVKRNRVLLIIDPATKMPPEQLDAFFEERQRVTLLLNTVLSMANTFQEVLLLIMETMIGQIVSGPIFG